MLMMMPDKKVTSVYCDMYHVAYQECDDGFKLIMKFENGPMVTIEVGTSHYIEAPPLVCLRRPRRADHPRLELQRQDRARQPA